MKRSLPLLAGALALALGACTNDGADTADTGLTGNDPGVVDTMPDPITDMGNDALADGDRTALMAVVAVDEHEIAAAEQALDKDVEGDVRAYAETLQTDHERNLEATRALLDDGVVDGMAGDNPELEAMKQKHEDERERLGEMDGTEYRDAWIDAMVTGHQEALTKLDDQLIPGATDEQVRQHLQTTRDAIARHLETAQGLQDGEPAQ